MRARNARVCLVRQWCAMQQQVLDQLLDHQMRVGGFRQVTVREKY